MMTRTEILDVFDRYRDGLSEGLSKSWWASSGADYALEEIRQWFGVADIAGVPHPMPRMPGPRFDQLPKQCPKCTHSSVHQAVWQTAYKAEDGQDWLTHRCGNCGFTYETDTADRKR